MSKIAVIFPGIGYHTDKPLLYYSGKLAAAAGYEIIKISYPKYDVNLKQATKEQLATFVKMCLEATTETLKDAGLGDAEDVLFISKSIGTVVAAAYAKEIGVDATHTGADITHAGADATCAGTGIRQVYFTPLEETFDYVKKGVGIAFNGTKDNWADYKKVQKLAAEYDIPLTTIEDANHSLETGDAVKDIQNLEKVILKLVEEEII
jgi:phosphoglycolate phosphatase